MTERLGDCDEPTNDTSRQPWLHELSVVVRGNATAVSRPGGDIRAVAAPVTRLRGATRGDGSDPAVGTVDGLYVDERRVLSVLTVSLGDEPLSPVAGSDRASMGIYLSSARHLGDPLPDPTVEVRRVRTVRHDGMDEDVVVTSRAVRPVRARLVLELGGDGAEITDVKRGASMGALLPASRMRNGVEWADARHETRVTLDPVPAVVRTGTGERPSSVSYLVDLNQGESFMVRVRADTRRRFPSAFDADAAANAMSWADVVVTGADPRLGRGVRTALEDLHALLMVDPRSAPGTPDVFAAAGAPWFLTLFGRDSIWAARLTLPFGTDLARGTLRALARRLADRHDPAVSAAPGKVLHEVRRMPTDPGSGRSRAAVYYGTVDATPLWICLLHDAWRWGMAEEDVAGLIPALRRTITWLTEYSCDDGSGLLRYVDASGSGLVNQGWKDSGDSMRDRRGRIAAAPITLVEAQGYAVEAAYAAASLADAFGLGEGGALRDWGAQLAGRIRDRFWVDGPGGRYLAMALDANGSPVDGVGSNMGHLLGTGALTQGESAEVARVIAGPSLLGPFGVATLSRDNPAYNPIGYHTGSVWTHDTAICCWSLVRAGHPAEARRVAAVLLDAMEAFDYHCPELYAGEALLGRPVPYPASCHPQAWAAAAAAVLVTEALGLSADVPGGTVRMAPPEASPYGLLRVTGLRVAGAPMDVDVSVDGSVTVRVDAPGLELRTG